MEIPIVLFHKSENIHVSYALRAAKMHHDSVIMITDTASSTYSAYAKVASINSYQSALAEQFAKLYKHLSSNSYEFEYVCIERWFILLEFMKKNQIEQCVYIDSDVLLCENITKVISTHYSAYDFCVCIPQQRDEDFFWSASGHISLWTYSALEKFCDFILMSYADHIDLLLKKWQWHLDCNIPGGICDMTLIYLFQKKTNLKFDNFLSIAENTFCFDNAINASLNEFPDEYETEYSFLLGHDIKKIRYKNGLPYCYNKILQKEILFYCLHCQSDAKRLMPFLIRDKKGFRQYLSDELETLKFFYGAFRREISKKIRKRALY